MIIDYGETFSSDTFEVRSSAGALANAGSVACTLTLPDGTTVSPTVANTGTGLYAFDFTPAGAELQAGHHVFTITATGGTLGSLVRKWTGSYDVESDQPLISVRDATAHLRAAGIIEQTTEVEQLRWLCLAATHAIERDLGRAVIRRAVTEIHDGGSSVLRLRVTPVISITAVTETGYSVTTDGYLIVDPMTGLLARGSSTYRQHFSWGRQNIAVSYIAGWVNPPPEIRLMTLNVVQSLWQSSQQAPHPLVDEFAASESLGRIQTAELYATPLSRAYDSHRAAGL